MSEKNFEELINTLSNLPVRDMASLVKQLEEAWGVSAAAQVAQVAAPTEEAKPVEEQTSFNVILKSAGASKLNVIKEVRAITNLGLKEAKELVESTPKAIKEDVSKQEAEDFKSKLVAAGAEVELQ